MTKYFQSFSDREGLNSSEGLRRMLENASKIDFDVSANENTEPQVPKPKGNSLK